MISLKAVKRKGKEVELEMIPAVLYGPGIENLNIAVSFKEFQSVHKEAGETLIELVVDGVSYSVLIHDMQLDTMTSDPIHVDFYQPNLKSEVEAHVPVELVGVAPAVGLGGTLVVNIHELPVKALPKDLPAKIDIDITGLKEIGSHLQVKDLKLPKGVIIVSNSEEVIIQIVAPTDVDAELAQPVVEVTSEKKEAE
ncbi:MAG: 50S ribosomal protein L25/general stress protein Ctc [Minisyncoccus archaeiphilus]|jgi:large subunit ribosomal protein L25|uniref:50S ribosomal protein L25 n=1 Tax=Minisyncoccus archaeiphilus TaxID=3238481 RepID=UPI0009CED8BA|nr:MAG: 50S ribosomal protein L25 [Parcubacteria group bacterium ADurb.Bin216]GMX59830.1 MAG: 50S ribosomal protein L25/general stress protein Ctc [Candidatus Parcubacteria bacterium]